jgi:LAS superfamily LD-carboxypeptidase LdcB
MFVFMVRQNAATADGIIKKPNYSSTSMTDFITINTNQILSDAIVDAKDKYKSDFDLTSDYSLQKYISDDNLLENKRYAPSDLVQIDTDVIVNRAGRPYLRQPASFAFDKMAHAFNKALDRQFYLISAYRTFHDQATLFE